MSSFPPAGGSKKASAPPVAPAQAEPQAGKSLQDSIKVKDAAVKPGQGIQTNGDPQVNQF